MPKITASEAREVPFRKRSVQRVGFFVPEDVMMHMTIHADAGLQEGKEIMGLIIGTVYRDDGGEYAVAESIINSDLKSDSVSVRFDGDSMGRLIDAIDEMEDGKSVVGWYHSHPGYGCFMSETDIRTQDGLFGGRCGFSVVIDPTSREILAFDSTVGAPKVADMIIME